MFDIKEIKNEDEKSSICEVILRGLPNWFGVEQSIVDYVKAVRHMPLFAAIKDMETVGFAAVKVHNAYTAEVCVMGVKHEYHRMGIGERLISACEEYCRTNGHSFLTVKTLDASRESKSYEKTRNFYYGVGFKPLEVFPTIWDEDNPCLFMVKCIKE